MNTTMANKNRLRILVVDDNELNCLLTTIALNGDYDVLSITDGHEALLEMERNRFDLVLMDLDMPELSGFEVASIYRRRDVRDRQSPIIALSALRDPASIGRARAAGMDDHISRPIAAPDLKREVARLLEAHAGGATLPSVWCRLNFDGLTSSLGFERTESFLVGLIEKFDAVRSILSENDLVCDDLRRHLHDLTSAAGLLGFQEVSLICREGQELPIAQAFGVAKLLAAFERAEGMMQLEFSKRH